MQQVSAAFGSSRLIRNTFIDIAQLAVFSVLEIVASHTSIWRRPLVLPCILCEILSFYLDVHEACEIDNVSAMFHRSSLLESFQNSPDPLVGTEYVP